MICKKIALFLVLSAMSLSVNATDLRVGAMSGPEGMLADTAAKVAKEKYGIDVEIVKFNDYIAPNVALNDGSLDANAINNKTYMDNINKSRGFNLVAVGNTFLYPIAGYSNNLKDISELKEGATIAIPNDPSNEGRALILLSKNGFIKLRDEQNVTPTVLDISENPNDYKIIELDGAQLPRVLNQVDLAIINNTFSVVAGLSPKDALLVEGKDSPYVNFIAARADNADNENLKKFVKAYESDEVEAAADKAFNGGAVKGW